MNQVLNLAPKTTRGLSMGGFILLLAILGFVAYTGMRLGPLYVDYFNVAKAFDQVASQTYADTATVDTVHRALETQELSQYFADADISTDNITLTSSGKPTLNLDYERQVKWVSNIYFTVKFHLSEPIPTTSPGQSN